jgi:hypothetical protein
MYNGSIYNPYATPALRQEVITVNGRNGAEAYQMAPNSSILLLDETAPIVWLKTTDGASYPTVTGYTITPIKPKLAPTVESNELFTSLEERIKKLEELVNAKSDVAKIKTSKSGSDK